MIVQEIAMKILSSGGTRTDGSVRECKRWSFSDFGAIADIYEQCSGRDIGLWKHSKWWLFNYPELMLVYQMPVGVVGYCRVGHSGEVSIGLAVGYRARGLGRTLLEEMTRRITESGHKEHVWARIAVENRVSQECFKACRWAPTRGLQEPSPARVEDIWKIQ